MTRNAPPSQNPANADDFTGVLQLVLTKFLQGVDDMLPARVLAYDRVKNIAQVQPLISMVTTLNEIVSRAQVAAVPVLQLGGGGFVLSFPVKSGDLGWLKSNDRDISLFKKTYASTPPNTQRKHSFQDAILIPDVMMQGVTIAGEDQGNAVFQNLNGTVKIALWPHQLKILSPNSCITDIASHVPDPNAVLDLQSTTRALHVPTMTSGQKNSIPSPHVGFLVYDIDKPGLSSYDGSTWS